MTDNAAKILIWMSLYRSIGKNQYNLEGVWKIPFWPDFFVRRLFQSSEYISISPVELFVFPEFEPKSNFSILL